MLLDQTSATTIYTDSAKHGGFGAMCRHSWFAGMWYWRSMNNALLELYPVLLALTIWAIGKDNQTMAVYSDNMAAVSTLNKLYSKDSCCVI